jgi:transposase, IS5 family
MKEQLDFHSHAVLTRVKSDNQWRRLNELISWESFRYILKVLDRTGAHGGRPPYDPVVMFKVVLLGQWHNLSDNELEQVLQVRLDFMLFCGFSLSQNIPDSTTIQDYRFKMIELGLLEKCMKLLNKKLEEAKLKVKSGTLVVDSTIIEAAARPRNTIEPGDDTEPPTKTTSADPDAEWTKKGAEYHYGYKEHAVVAAEDGFIEDVQVTGASTHDGTMLKSVLKGKRGVQNVLADKAYASKKNREYLKTRRIRDSILRKAARNRPLTEKDIRHNKKLSQRRFVAEQQFGTKKQKFGFFRTRYFRLSRVQGQSYLKAICFNLLKAVRMLAPPNLATA